MMYDEAVLDRLTRDIEDFPTLPDVALRVNGAFEDPEFELAEVAAMIGQDPVLASRIVRLSRSPIFGGGSGGDTDLEQAILRLGAKETKNAVTAVAIMNTLPELPEPVTLVSFWTLSLGSAMSARQLALDLGIVAPEQAYLAGLVHTLGEAYLAIQFTERYRAAIDRSTENSAPLELTISREFEVSPAVIGARLLRTWRFPEAIAEAVEYHLVPQDAPEQKLLAGIVFAADRICRDLRLAPKDPGHTDQAWVGEIPHDFMQRIEALGYPDITYYLIEQREFLKSVEDSVRATFASR